MPFTESKDRRKMDRFIALQQELHGLGADIKPGDRCFVEYRRMMVEWTNDSRWTTVDQLASAIFPDEATRAYFLAFLVFFNFKALPYERMKQRENGDI